MAQRLLVVDDYEMNRNTLSRRLRRCGYEVEEAEGGRRAIEMLRGGGFDLVLLDVMMPDVDGFAVLRDLRSYSSTPVIMVTARDGTKEVVEAFRLGANDHISKPIDFDVTVARIRALLDRAAAVPQVEEIAEAAPSAVEDVPIGTRLGSYVLTGILGRGAVGVVYSAENTDLGDFAAIKMLQAGMGAEAAAEQRFRNEARAAARIEHPNVVGVYDVGKFEDRLYLAIELVSGRSAQDVIDERGALPWRDATRVIADACRGISAAHARGVIHCDLKPENILVCDDGSVKVTDFGLARVSGALPSGGAATTGGVAGTPYYMSPERIRSQRVDARSDIYSLGGAYYALLTGRHPYGHLDLWFDVVTAHCTEPPPEVGAEVPAPCGDIVRKAMAKSPAARFEAADMLSALEALLQTVAK